MVFCTKCGKELADSSVFCSACGAPVSSGNLYDRESGEERELISLVDRFLRYERLAWKIPSIVMLCFGGMFALMSLLFLLVSLTAEEPAMISPVIMLWLVHIPMVLSTSIVGFVNIKKIDNCRNSAAIDFRPAAERCGSVGMIVLAAFFNNVALVFVIINFVFLKSKGDIASRIIAKQQGAQMPAADFN